MKAITEYRTYSTALKPGFMRLSWFLGLLLLASGPLLAATITLETDRNQVGLNETFQLVFTVSGGQSGEPDFSPLNKDFQLLGTSSSSQISMINGDTTRSKKYTLRLAPKHAGELEIPSIAFGNEQSRAGSIQVLDRAPTTPDTPGVADELMLAASVDLADPYVQQQVLLTVKIYRRINWQQASLSELDAGGSDLLVQQLGEDKQYRTTMEGRTWEVIERKFALFPQQSGDMEINPFQLTVSVVDERQRQGRGYNDPFDRFFSSRPMVQKIARSDAIKLQVKPAAAGVLPWLAARDLRLQENWSADTQQLQAGESVTRTVAIIADGVSVGQLPELKMDELEGIKNYPDQPQTNEQASSQGLLSTSSRKFALIPASAGEFEIPPLEVNWWNVNADRMETARLPGRVLRVKGAAAALAEPQPPAQVEAPAAAAEESTSPSPVPSKQADKWLLWSNVLLLVLWLVTLFAWWKGRKSRPQAAGEAVKEQHYPVRRELLKVLDKAVAEKDELTAKDAILQLAKYLWPDNPPLSLAQVVVRTQDTLAMELNNLERSLYGAGQTEWDGKLIARELSRLGPDKPGSAAAQSRLKPLYPNA